MSLTVFMAVCILGCDFMLYVLFQWLYGEKRRKHVRMSAPMDATVRMRENRPYLVKPKLSANASKEEESKSSLAGSGQTLHAPAA